MVTARYFIIKKEEFQPEIKIKSQKFLKAMKKDEKHERLENVETVEEFLTKLADAKGVPVGDLTKPVMEVIDGKEEMIIPDVDDEPLLDLLQTFYPCASFEHEHVEYVVVKGIVSKEAIEAFGKFSKKDALCLDSLTALGLEDVIVGKDVKEMTDYVLAKFGVDLSGERQVGVDEDGKPEMAPYIIPVMIAGEE